MINLAKKRTTFPTATVQRMIKEVTNMMVSKELAEYEADILRKILVKRARRVQLYAQRKKKKLLKKEMAEIFDESDPPT